MEESEHLRYESALRIIEELHPSAYVLAKVKRKMQDPDVEVDDLIEILKNDQAITADVIHVSNSVFYGTNTESKDLRSAVSRIGFRELLKIISLCVAKSLLSKPLKYYGVDESESLSESISIALLMDVLSEHLAYDNQEGYTVGLLSTIGKSVIDKALDLENYVVAYDGKESLLEWEMNLMGFDHAHAGAMLLKCWDFPASITFMILHQFVPEKIEGDANMAYALNLSRHVVDTLGWGFREQEFEIDKKMLQFMKRFKMTEKKFVALIDDARERFDSVASELGIKRS